MLAAGEPFELERSQEYASLIIHRMVTGQPRTVYGNVRNTGLITNLPQDACVEVPCLVDRAGVQPTAVGDLPAQCAALDRTFLNVVELTVRAALDGDRAHVLHAVMLDPNAAATLSSSQMEDMVDELFAAHGDLAARGAAVRQRWPFQGQRPLDLLVVGDANPDVVLCRRAVRHAVRPGGTAGRERPSSPSAARRPSSPAVLPALA